jgi:DNA-binding NtrC family response regulator
VKSNKRVLVSWIAVNNDPFEQEGKRGRYRLVDGEKIPGPTLTLLFDEESPYRGHIDDFVLFYMKNSTDNIVSESQLAVQETFSVLKEKAPKLRIHLEEWSGKDPTDHQEIFNFIQNRMQYIRKKYAEHELVIHVSPGTPSMHTIWILMAETGFIEPPFKIVKSYRKGERDGRPAVVPVKIGIETFYKVYRSLQYTRSVSEKESIVWDFTKFQSSLLKKLYIEARRFARLNVPVLIFGERGTGKTTLAVWLRLNSPFRKESKDKNWPMVACGQYSPETMRAELFGYCKGAFTDAKHDREGLLAMADGDTLFLDEVGDVSSELQRLLIKVLEEKQYFRLGDDKPRKSEFRLLTATNLPTNEIKKRLDPDFLDRIGMLKLEVPPLRNIPEDIPWIWENVYKESCNRAQISKKEAILSENFHKKIIETIQQRPLYGNLRDLFQVAYRLLAAKTDPVDPLTSEDALDYALKALDEMNLRDPGDIDIAKIVANCFAESKTIDFLLKPEKPLKTDKILRDLKSFMAKEILKNAKVSSIKAEYLCDVTDRSLREWVKLKKKSLSGK